MNQEESIHFILTGGTIDSHYDGTKDTVVPNEESVIPKFIEGLKLYKNCAYDVVCMKDSRDISPGDVKVVLKIVKESPHQKIIITHGTYTMPDTARFIEANMERKDQVIILTGSMIPISGFSPSDGPFNIGYALAKLESLEPGVYVAMNGRIFSGSESHKIINEGRFSSIFEK